MATKLSAYERPLQKIFSNDYEFSIPSYQRPYRWTVDEVETLVDDLLDAVERQPTNGDGEPYFLGSVVLIKTDEKPASEVVDGQQRLTTLTMLIAALRQLIQDSDVAGALDQYLAVQGDPLLNLKPKPRLQLWQDHQKFFEKYIQTPGAINDLLAEPRKSFDQEVERRIWDNVSAIVERLTPLDDGALKALAAYLVANTYLVVVQTPDLESAHRIFSVLNDRGMQLSHADILKAEILGEISTADKNEYAERWQDAEELVGESNFADLFAHIRMIFAKTKQEKRILEEFRAQVVMSYGSKHGHAAIVDDVVVPYARSQAQILDCDVDIDTQSEAANAALRWLAKIDNFDWQPPALWAIAHRTSDPQWLVTFLTDLERLATSMFLRRVDVTRRIQRYGSLLTALESDQDMFDPGSPLQLDPKECAETVTRLDGPVYDTARTRMLVLQRLDAALAGSYAGATYDHKVVTIEHVLPQTPDERSDWTALFSEEEREIWTHRLANLLLLNSYKNSAAQNYDFEKKKEKYFTGKHGVAAFPITTRVLNEPEWTPVVLTRLQGESIDMLRRVWRL